MAASRETPTPSLLSISQLEGPVQLPSVLGASQAVWRELGAILLGNLAAVVGPMGAAHAWVFPGPVPKILGCPVKPYLFCCLRPHDAFEELETELRPPQAGLLG